MLANDFFDLFGGKFDREIITIDQFMDDLGLFLPVQDYGKQIELNHLTSMTVERGITSKTWYAYLS